MTGSPDTDYYRVFFVLFFFTEFLLGGLEEAHDGGFQRWFDGSRRC